MPSLPPKITKVIRILAGAGISAGLIWLFLKDVQLGEVANSLKMADPIFSTVLAKSLTMERLSSTSEENQPATCFASRNFCTGI